VPGTEVLDRAALDAVGGSPRTVRVDATARVAVVGGIGVDQHALGAALLRLLGLDAAEGAAVADEHAPVADVDAESLELGVVPRQAAVGVDDLTGHVARRRVRVVSDDDIAGIAVPRHGPLGVA
jgi:hypothetical protein